MFSQTKPNVIISVTNGVCQSDGKITVTATNTAPPVLYELLDANSMAVVVPQQGSNIFNNLPAGNYLVLVYDANTGTTPVVKNASVTSPYQLLEFIGTEQSYQTIPGNQCSPQGYLSVSIVKGRAPYQYELLDATGTTVLRPYQSSNFFYNLARGQYTVRVLDDCGSSRLSGVITVVEDYSYSNRPIDSVNIEDNTPYNNFFINATCDGLTVNGQKVNIYSGGQKWPDFNYASVMARFESPALSGNWGPWTALSNPAVPVGGAYDNSAAQTVRMQVENPCTLESKYYTYTVEPTDLIVNTIISPGASNMCGSEYLTYLSSTLSSFRRICNPITITIQEEGGPYNRVVTGNMSSHTFHLPSLVAGKTYNITISDAANFSKTTRITLPQSTLQQPIFTLTGYMPCSLESGRISVKNILSNGPYPITFKVLTGPGNIGQTYIMNSGVAANDIFQNMPFGVYSIEVSYGSPVCRTDTLSMNLVKSYTRAVIDSVRMVPAAKGCGFYDVQTYARFFVPAGSKGNVAHNSFLVNTQTGDVVQGIPAGSNFARAFYNLPSGNYYVKVYTNGGSPSLCPKALDSLLVTLPPYMPPQFDQLKSGGFVCNGRDTGTLHVEGVGSSPFTYRLKPAGVPDASYTPFQGSPDFHGLAPGNYTIQILDGCGTQVTPNVELFNTASTSLIRVSGAVSEGKVCPGGRVVLRTRPIGSIANIIWTLPDGSTRSGIDSIVIPSFTAANSGSYQLVVTAGTGCVATSTESLQQALSPSLQVTPVSICEGDSVNLTLPAITAGSTNVDSIAYFVDAGGTTPLGNPNRVTPTVTTTYYITAYSVDKCASGNQPVQVTVNRRATAADINIRDTVICTGASVALTASSSTVPAPVFRWYADASLTTLLFTGNTYSAPSHSASTTYYVTVTGTGVCENFTSNIKAVTVAVHPYSVAADIQVNDQNICYNSIVRLVASTSHTGAGKVFKWYKDPQLTNLLFTGDVYETPHLTATTTYYVTLSSQSSCENLPNTAKAVTVTVDRNATTADLFARSTSICAGESAMLTASSNLQNPVFRWYQDPSLTQLYAVGPMINTPPLNSQKQFFVTVSADGICENQPGPIGTGPVVVNVDVRPHTAPADVSVQNPVICAGSTASLTATSSLPGTNFSWYADPGMNTLLGTGNTFVTPPTSNTTTYYVAASSGDYCGPLPGDAKQVTVTANRNADSSDIKGLNQHICSGVSATLVVGSPTISNPQFTWFADAALTQPVGLGSSFTTPALTGTTNYYVAAEGANVCRNLPGTAKRITVTVTSLADLTDLALKDSTICAGNTIVLTAASTTVANPVFTWYADSALTIPLTSGANHTTTALQDSITYYVTVQGTDACENAPSNAGRVRVNVNRNAVVADITGSGQTICAGDSAVLIVQSAIPDPRFTWFADAALTQPLVTGDHYQTSALNTSTDYYVAVSGTGVCSSRPGDAYIANVIVNRNATVADINAAGKTVCSGNSATLTATTTTVKNPVFNWYADDSLHILLATGPTYITSDTAVTDTFYVTVQGDAVCANIQGAAKAVVLTVQRTALPDDITAADIAICPNSAATLTANSKIKGAVFNWYSDISLQHKVATGPGYTISALDSSATFYVTVSGDSVCASLPGDAKAVQVTVNRTGISADIIVVDTLVCPGEGITLNATSTVPGAVFTWYADPGLTTVLSTSASYAVPAINTTSFYYVTVKGDNVCENQAADAHTVTVGVKRRATAADILVNDQAICAGQAATLVINATNLTRGLGSEASPVYRWYADAGLTNLLFTGTTYITPVLQNITTYYVTASSRLVCENAVGSAKAVTVTIRRNSTAADITVAGQAVCVGEAGTLTASSAVTGAVFTWYSDAALQQQVGAGATYTTPPLDAATTYYVSVSGDSVCSSLPGTAKTVLANVNRKAVANDITIRDTLACPGEGVTLIATSTVPGAVFTWYGDPALTTLLGTGASFSTPAITTTSLYYVTVQGTDVCENKAGDAHAVTVGVKRRATAADILVNNQEICPNQSATLVISTTDLTRGLRGEAGPVFRWYADAALTNLLFTGTVYTTPVLVNTTTYYVTASSNLVCENEPGTAKPVTVTLLRNSTTADVTAEGLTICAGATGTVVASSNITNPVYNWYSDAARTNLLFTGPAFTTPPLAITTQYFLTVNGDGICEGPSTPQRVPATVTVTVNRHAVASDITAADQSGCAGNAVTMTAGSSVTNPVFTWYTDAELNHPIAAGASFTTPALSTSATYYVTVNGSDACENFPPNGKAVNIAIARKAVASDISVKDTVICSGNTVQLTASSSIASPVFNWYADPAHNQLLFTGASFTTPALSASANYYITVSGTGVCENDPGTSKVVTVTVQRNSVTADATVAGMTICAGETATLVANSQLSNPVFNWYSDANRTSLIFTGPVFTTPVLAATKNYYVAVSGNGVCEGPSTIPLSVTVAVNRHALAADITTADQSICEGNAVTMTASSDISNPVFSWYTDAGLNNPVAAGASFTTPSLSAPATYYVTVNGTDACENFPPQAKPVNIIVSRKAVAADIIIRDTVICAGSNVQLNASSGITNPVFKWYADPGLTQLVFTGASFTTPALSASVTYYINVTGEGVCVNGPGDVQQVTVTVNRNATAADIVVAPRAICKGDITTLLATSNTIAQPVFNWYADAALSQLLYTGEAFQTPVPTATTSYYLTVAGTNVCVSNKANAQQVTVTVNRFGTATDINVADTSFCEDGIATLRASSSMPGAIFKWYRDAALTSLAGTGATFVTPALNTTTEYYVTINAPGVCENLPGAGKPVKVTINRFAVPTDIILQDTTACPGGRTTLTASSTLTNPVFTWYADPGLTRALFTGAAFTTPPLYNITSYYVSVTATGVCSNKPGGAKTVRIAVKRSSTREDLAATDRIICAGNTATLNANLPARVRGTAIFRWYADAGLTTLLATGSTFTTPSLQQTTHYYVTMQNDVLCENTPGNAREAIVKVFRVAAATDIVGNDVSICEGNNVLLNVTAPSVNTPAFNWYADSALTQLLDYGPTFATPAIRGNTVYYVTVTGDSVCANPTGAAKAINVMVSRNAVATDIAVNSASICQEGTAVLNANSTVPGATFNWYADPALTQKLATGPAFTTPALTTSTNYYVTVQGTGVCENSPLTAKQVFVNVNYKAIAADVTLKDTSTCQGSPVTITATSRLTDFARLSSPLIYNWYADAGLTNKLYTGATFTTPPITATTTYYVTVSNNTICENAANDAQAITVSVGAGPSAPVLNVPAQEALWSGSNLTLTATAAGANAFTWYKNNVVISSVTGNTLNLANVSVTDAALYEVSASYPVGCSVSARASFRLDVKDFTTWKEVRDASGDNSAQPGEVLTYIIYVRNTGTVPLADVNVSDPIPANTSYLTGSGGTLTGGNVLFGFNSLSVGSTQQAGFQVMVKNSTAGISSINNMALVTIDTVTNETGTTPTGPPGGDTTKIPFDGGGRLVFIPNVITPNGDGRNDKLVIKGLENYPASSIAIYNRWGNEVYYNSSYHNEWDGNGLTESTYYYVLKLRIPEGIKTYTGWIQLIR
ncbi:gliding motility-associated C-terminal domain-containing protein [Chitinophaga sp. ARDCPP14]|uniref:Ig-like domain-containing protein n=1 Tax=Chitinophaga sp. ARDCPP14 TaxID=3391139 RepID=UPI003F51CCC5